MGTGNLSGNLFALGDKAPALPEGGQCFVAPGAQLIGDVTLGDRVSIWFNAVLRGDNDPIRIGAGSNIQDGCVCHTDPGFPLTVGENVTVGHKALLHGCTIGDGSLIGMGAVILNGARIGRGCLIGANALVTEGKEIPDRSLVMGQPGRVVRALDETAAEALAKTAETYQERITQYLDGLRPA